MAFITIPAANDGQGNSVAIRFNDANGSIQRAIIDNPTAELVVRWGESGEITFPPSVVPTEQNVAGNNRFDLVDGAWVFNGSVGVLWR